jgi:arylsulfatase A-like enzyme
MRLALLGLALCLGCAPEPAARPNVLLFLADDQGWNGTSVAMDDRVAGSRSDFYQTPVLERLAREGTRFAQAYASSPVCSPTRASIQTGKSPARLGMTDVIMGASGRALRAERLGERLLREPASLEELPEAEITLPEAIRAVRPEYATGFFGKWHLGAVPPDRHGYTHHHVLRTEGVPAEALRREMHGLGARIAQFLRSRARDGRPFFVHVSHPAIHNGYPAREAARKLVSRRPRGQLHRDRNVAAMTADLDADLGLLLRTLDELGIADTTYVIYFSDNGGDPQTSSSAPLRGGKFSLLEGGIRVPLLVRGPGVASGRVVRVPVVAQDLLPTILEWLAIHSLPEGVDGGSFAALLRGSGEGRVERPREELVWHFPHSHFFFDGSAPQSAIRRGDLKLIVDLETRRAELFDLASDPSEATDLATARPALARELGEQLERHLADVRAPTPRLRS